MSNNIVIFDSGYADTLVYETGQTDTLIWEPTQFTVIAGIDLCDLTGIGVAISCIGQSVKIDLIGEMFSIFIGAASLRFDGIGILFKGQFTAVKSLANWISFYSWLSSNSESMSSVIEGNKGELLVTSNRPATEIVADSQKIDVIAQPNNEC